METGLLMCHYLSAHKGTNISGKMNIQILFSPITQTPLPRYQADSYQCSNVQALGSSLWACSPKYSILTHGKYLDWSNPREYVYETIWNWTTVQLKDFPAFSQRVGFSLPDTFAEPVNTYILQQARSFTERSPQLPLGARCFLTVPIVLPGWRLLAPRHLS